MTRRHLSTAALSLALAAVYFGAAKFGLSLAVVHPSASEIWIPTGIALAALLVWGKRFWPAIFLGAFLANATTAGSLMAATGISIGNTLEAVVGAWLVRRFANGVRAFDRPFDILRFVLLGAVPSTLVSATIGVTSLCLDGAAQWSQFASVWSAWWLGDLFGDLIMAPFLVIWLSKPAPRLNSRSLLEAAGLLAVLVALCQAIFLEGLAAPAPNQFKYLTILPLIWATMRFGQRGAVTAVFVVAGIALWATLNGIGPFVTSDQNETLLLLQIFLGAMTATALLLAAVVTQRKHSESALRQMTVDLQVTHAQLLEYAGSLETKVKARTDELSNANVRLQNALAERLELDASRENLRRQLANAHEDERRRIARELHDQMGQRVIALGLGLKALKDAAARHEAIRSMVPPLEELTSQTGHDLHRVALELRQPALDDLGLVSTIRSHVSAWSQRTGIAADFQQHGYEEASVSAEIETTLYRFVQEALNNVAKHAGATQVSVILERNDVEAQGIVEDNGCGFDAGSALNASAASGKLGLLGMQERLVLVGGTLNIESAPNRGTTLFARAPLEYADRNEKPDKNSHPSR